MDKHVVKDEVPPVEKVETVWLDADEISSRIGFQCVKRIIDIVLSAVGLVCLIPVFIVVAILMKKEEPKGPIFFKQTRVGRNGKEFTMYKFRSMCVDAEEKLAELLAENEIKGAMFKMKDDPRVTKIGKAIRRNSIDELPQLLNVLKGDMSLIGPRPPLPREVKEYSRYDLQRLLVKPGCSGPWQISGRNEVNFAEMVELDIQYIREQSLMNDIKIIWKTVRIMIIPNGAY
ncbi:sugar transferase [Enterococcus pallens]|uniref:Bacterial sugar transferase domain-containing protein n=1 Tax=Enterococcus pallens ATCC BAA-351 TaxID=1158607 RepID=R2QI93_9ENTE|nr:sugar transferase [Enterococcus pallens]EOH94898.1 hypothetical protein UAU_01820 [Enterococcus pallens ATCC BAA-351]EOU14783.1 hypothetical protein I588_04433 [Enterococcus pallens ATCC BAA-351]OJG77182.1 hypothetical protein RV10_GL002921 [Enterococcus pallens]